MINSLKEYYDQKSVLNEIFNNIENPNWHYWKVVDLSGVIRQNKKRINSTNRLREFIGNKPSKIYVSIAQFMQPQRVYGKHPDKRSQWVIDDSLFIKSDLLFDLDSEEDLSIAHNDGKELIRFMEKEEGYELLNIRYSGGGKGFHLLYRDNEPIIEKDPIKRYEKTQKKREELIERLPKLQTIDELHKKIIADQFRVHAVIGTIKAETGFKVERIDLKDFMVLKTEQLLKSARKMLVKPNVADDNKKNLLTNTTDGKPSVGLEGANITSNSYNFVDNAVKGIKSTIIEDEVDYRYVTVLKYPINKDATNIIKNVQKVYNLDSFYKFIYRDVQMFINFKLVDRRRLEKIMKFSKPMNLNSFMFYGHSWIPIEGVCLREIIGSVYGVNDIHSRPHANLLNLKFNDMAGKERNRICKAMVKHGTN